MAAHPLSPPCYSERAVPQLACRVRTLAGRDPETGRPGAVVLAAHSQGSVLAVAALAELDSDQDADARRRIALLTFGSPLLRLYASIYPTLLWKDQLDRLLVVDDGPRRWCNLWRRTDPIGSTLAAVLGRADDVTQMPDAGDLRLTDPHALGMDPAKSAYYPVYGHSSYYRDPLYQRVRDLLLRRATR